MIKKSWRWQAITMPISSLKTRPAARKEKELTPLVAKIAALVRLADAMDRSYQQKIKVCKVSIKDGTMLIEAKSKVDLTLEEWTFAGKATFFEEVYGLKAILERVSE